MSKSPNTTKLQTNLIWIDTRDGLSQLITKLATEKVIAVDTESDSLYSYFEKVCLRR